MDAAMLMEDGIKGSRRRRHLTPEQAGGDPARAREVREAITATLGTDLSKIANELTKLLVSLPEGARRIADTDIERLIHTTIDAARAP